MLKKLLDNFRKPSGVIGGIACKVMNVSHETSLREVFERISVTPDVKALDIGCGGGWAMRLMLERGATVTGIDHSVASVARSLTKVAEYVEQGKARVDYGSVRELPYPDESFDLVTAMETIYFWPDMEEAFKEVFRVLRPGGRFVVAVAAWKNADGSVKCPKFFRENLDMNFYSEEELRAFMDKAGFAASETSTGRKAAWMAVSGEKAAA